MLVDATICLWKALGGGLDNAAVNSLLQQADSSGDGVLSVHEFVRRVSGVDIASIDRLETYHKYHLRI